MTPSAFDFSEFEENSAVRAAPIVPPLDLRAIEATYHAQQETEKARAALTGSNVRDGLFRDPALAPVSMTLGLVSLFIAALISSGFLLEAPFVLPTLLLIALIPVGATKLLQMNQRLEAAQAALALSEASPQWIVPCIRSLEVLDWRQREIAANLLTRLLPLAPPHELRGLSPAQRHTLYKRLALAPQQFPEFAMAILQAIERAEDLSAAPYLELAAPRFALTPKARIVRAAAIRCGEFLDSVDARERERMAALQGTAAQSQTAGLSKEEQAEAARVQKLLDAMEKEFRRRKPGMRAGFLAATWMIIFPFCLFQFISYWQAGWQSGLAWFWGLATLACTQSHRLTLLGRQSEAARQLASCDSVRAVGPLAEALEWPDEALQRVASTALIRLLPRLKASDANLLNPKQRAILYKTLRPMNANRKGRLLCAILAALEQVGDKSALPAVSRLESMLAITAAQRSVRTAAKRCLPYLNANAENARSSQTLLRASSASEVSSDTLLRPSSNQETPPEQLLRASSEEE